MATSILLRLACCLFSGLLVDCRDPDDALSIIIEQSEKLPVPLEDFFQMAQWVNPGLQVKDRGPTARPIKVDFDPFALKKEGRIPGSPKVLPFTHCQSAQSSQLRTTAHLCDHHFLHYQNMIGEHFFSNLSVLCAVKETETLSASSVQFHKFLAVLLTVQAKNREDLPVSTRLCFLELDDRNLGLRSQLEIRVGPDRPQDDAYFLTEFAPVQAEEVFKLKPRGKYLVVSRRGKAAFAFDSSSSKSISYLTGSIGEADSTVVDLFPVHLEADSMRILNLVVTTAQASKNLLVVFGCTVSFSALDCRAKESPTMPFKARDLLQFTQEFAKWVCYRAERSSVTVQVKRFSTTAFFSDVVRADDLTPTFSIKTSLGHGQQEFRLNSRENDQLEAFELCPKKPADPCMLIVHDYATEASLVNYFDYDCLQLRGREVELVKDLELSRVQKASGLVRFQKNGIPGVFQVTLRVFEQFSSATPPTVYGEDLPVRIKFISNATSFELYSNQQIFERASLFAGFPQKFWLTRWDLHAGDLGIGQPSKPGPDYLSFLHEEFKRFRLCLRGKQVALLDVVRLRLIEEGVAVQVGAWLHYYFQCSQSAALGCSWDCKEVVSLLLRPGELLVALHTFRDDSNFLVFAETPPSGTQSQKLTRVWAFQRDGSRPTNTSVLDLPEQLHDFLDYEVEDLEDAADKFGGKVVYLLVSYASRPEIGVWKLHLADLAKSEELRLPKARLSLNRSARFCPRHFYRSIDTQDVFVSNLCPSSAEDPGGPTVQVLTLSRVSLLDWRVSEFSRPAEKQKRCLYHEVCVFHRAVVTVNRSDFSAFHQRDLDPNNAMLLPTYPSDSPRRIEQHKCFTDDGLFAVLVRESSKPEVDLRLHVYQMDQAYNVYRRLLKVLLVRQGYRFLDFFVLGDHFFVATAYPGQPLEVKYFDTKYFELEVSPPANPTPGQEYLLVPEIGNKAVSYSMRIKVTIDLEVGKPRLESYGQDASIPVDLLRPIEDFFNYTGTLDRLQLEPKDKSAPDPRLVRYVDHRLVNRFSRDVIQTGEAITSLTALDNQYRKGLVALSHNGEYTNFICFQDIVPLGSAFNYLVVRLKQHCFGVRKLNLQIQDKAEDVLIASCANGNINELKLVQFVRSSADPKKATVKKTLDLLAGQIDSFLTVANKDKTSLIFAVSFKRQGRLEFYFTRFQLVNGNLQGVRNLFHSIANGSRE